MYTQKTHAALSLKRHVQKLYSVDAATQTRRKISPKEKENRVKNQGL
jgi:hypothetical protein